jgi:glycosyltransferase involved in cell wall biosynthesis
MRILVVIYEFPPVGGGGGRAAQDICRGLVERGHEVCVLTAHLKGLERQEEMDGFRVIRVPSARSQAFKAGLLPMAGFVIAGIPAGLQLVRYWRPDVIHVHFAVPSGPVAWVISQFYHIPYVLTAHLGDVPGGVPEKTGRWFRWIYPLTPTLWKRAAQVVAVSEYTRQLARQTYRVDIQVIPNGVDLNLLDPGEIEVGNPPQVVFAARLMPQKNPVEFVNILAKVSDLPWRCVMMGDGPLRGAVEAAIERHGLKDRFIMPGWVTPEEVLAHFARSDLLFMPSLSEGFPVVGVQGLAMGLALVGSRAGGMVDLVEQGRNGFLYPINDSEGMAQGLRVLLSDPQALLAARLHSREFARQYDLNRVVEGYLTIFNAICKK